jgi:hypothetical protein
LLGLALGLGAFEGLDDEMVIVDGHFFQVSADGSVRGRGQCPEPFRGSHRVLFGRLGMQEMSEYGRRSGVALGPVDVVCSAEAFGAKGLKIERPEEISSTLKKVLAMPGPVIVGVPVDYRDNHRLMENVHPDALN